MKIRTSANGGKYIIIYEIIKLHNFYKKRLDSIKATLAGLPG